MAPHDPVLRDALVDAVEDALYSDAFKGTPMRRWPNLRAAEREELRRRIASTLERDAAEQASLTAELEALRQTILCRGAEAALGHLDRIMAAHPPSPDRVQ